MPRAKMPKAKRWAICTSVCFKPPQEGEEKIKQEKKEATALNDTASKTLARSPTKKWHFALMVLTNEKSAVA